MVSGHLHEKNGLYYIILNIFVDGKRKPKWIATGITAVRGNKKKAEAMLAAEKNKHENKITEKLKYSDMLFTDFMWHWLEVAKSTIEIVTYSSYRSSVEVIERYFKNKPIILAELQAKDIQDFYAEQLKRVKASTMIHYHANIHRALKYDAKIDMIPFNPADKVERPKRDRFTGSFYDTDEIDALFEAVEGSKLEIPVLLP